MIFFVEDWWPEAVDIFCVNFQCDDVSVGNDPGDSGLFGNLVALSEYASGLSFGYGYFSRIVFFVR